MLAAVVLGAVEQTVAFLRSRSRPICLKMALQPIHLTCCPVAIVELPA